MELKARENENLAKEFTPNGKAEEFIKQIGNQESRVNIWMGGNGTTKTATGSNILCNIIWGPQNAWFEHGIYKNWPYAKRARIVSDPTTLKTKTVPELKKWFPSNRFEIHYETSKDGKQYESLITTNTGWTIDLLSNEQDSKEGEAADVSLVWFDEPASRDWYTASIARLRMGGIFIWTMTPLFRNVWIKDDIVDKEDGTNIKIMYADAESNCKVHGERGILEHDQIEFMISQYSEAEKEARIHGRFGHLVGKVHKKFSREIHVIKPYNINKRKFCVYAALDTHPRVEEHMIWMAVNRLNQKFFIAELVMKGTAAELAYKIQEIESTMRVEERLIDPSAFNKDDRRPDEPSFGEQLEQEGITFELGSKDLVNGIKSVDDELDYEMRGGVFIRRPNIFFFETCSIAIKQMENYIWGEYKGPQKDERQPLARPKDKDDHQPENIRRLIHRRYEFIPYEEPTDYEREISNKDLDPYE